MKEHLETVELLARDLRNGKEFPRSPRETLAGYVLAARVGGRRCFGTAGMSGVSPSQPSSHLGFALLR
jgi:hypothetical protein